MKKVFLLSIFSLAMVSLTTSAKAQQSQNTCYAYGHHKVACPGSNSDQKTVSPKEEGKQTKDSDRQSEKKDSSANSPQTSNKKYNATEFKTKHYFLSSCR